MGSLEGVNDICIEVLKTVGDIFMIVIAIMCAILFSAVVVLWIVDQSHTIANKDKKIAELSKDVEELKKSKSEVYKKNENTSQITDKIFDMYLSEKSRNDDLESNIKKWDSMRIVRICALEQQLRDNGIEPIKWEEMKFAA